MSIITSESKGHILTFTNTKYKKHLYELDNKIVPSVTGINKKGFPTPERLLNWYKKNGLESNTISKDAADVGKILHKYAELKILNQSDSFDWDTVDKHEYEKEIKICIDHFENWYAKNTTKTLHSELLVGSPTYQFAGTLDRLSLNEHDEVGIEDYKTSSGFFVDQFVQMAGYKIALYEWKELEAKWFRINLFGKKKAEFHQLLVNREGWFLDGVLYKVDAYAMQKLESQFLRNRKTFSFVQEYEDLFDEFYDKLKGK